MELPKNVTQIGQVNKDCKIYIEDYVISYMKQLNQSAQDKRVTVALYGKHQSENGISYYFLYGACRVELLPREVRHLSQAQLQEIERGRKRYFPELEFAGYRILNGEMIEGLHICEQEICRYIGGYARFYEKNDSMLAYMLAAREQPEPEQVDRTKYEEVKKRQEERRSEADSANEENVQPIEWLKRSVPTSANLQKMRLAAVGGFALLCLLGIGTFRENDLRGDTQSNDENMAVSATAKQGMQQKETLRVEDKLEQVLLAENKSKGMENDSELPQPPEAAEAITESEVPQESKVPQESEVPQGSKVPQGSEEASESVAASEGVVTPEDREKEEEKEMSAAESSAEPQPKEATETSQKGKGAVAYIIQPGDTLIGICLRQYGSDVRLADVCSINDISNPDDIKEGQIILLPD